MCSKTGEVSPIADLTYFLQDQVSDKEGPHAEEVSREEWMGWAAVNLEAPIEFLDGDEAIYLRLDVMTAQGMMIGTPQ